MIYLLTVIDLLGSAFPLWEIDYFHNHITTDIPHNEGSYVVRAYSDCQCKTEWVVWIFMDWKVEKVKYTFCSTYIGLPSR